MSRTLSGSASGGGAEVADLEPGVSRALALGPGKERGEGSVVFRPTPADRGTEVAVELAYECRGMAADNCGIRKGDVIAVWGCGPVGQFAIRRASPTSSRSSRVDEARTTASTRWASRRTGKASAPSTTAPAFGKGLTFKMGQTHVHRYVYALLGLVERGAIDPSFVITHRFRPDEAAKAYELLKAKEDGCVKVVLTP